MLQSLYSVFDQIKKQAAFTASDPEAGIWAEQSIIQHRPVHFDTDYRLTSSIADKGRRQRADFVTIQSLVIDESGATVATLRQGAKWLRADSVPDNFLGIL